MPLRSRAAVILTLSTALLVAPHLASAQFGMGGMGAGGLGGSTFAFSLNTPQGDLAKEAGNGFGFMYVAGRGGPRAGAAEAAWSGRSVLSYDYFAGKGALASAQIFGGGLDVIHRSGARFYQFGGFRPASATNTYESSATSQSRLRGGFRFGFTGGLGVTLLDGESSATFVEAGGAIMLGGSTQERWVPIRIGIRIK
ncbi:MAG: hypothetical protein FJ202_08220 [Gemmatimonadetes bacterium]|nr:hypothetical protein [Gemmatimonadota bacterium]